jgi:hypothetical protein
MNLTKSIAVWVLIILAETVHGVVRTAVLEPRLGGFRARQLAVFTGSAIIFAVARRFYRGDASSRGALAATGLVWAALTVAFELALARVLGMPQEHVLTDYDLRRGGLLGLGITFMAACPLLAARGQRPGRQD